MPWLRNQDATSAALTDEKGLLQLFYVSKGFFRIDGREISAKFRPVWDHRKFRTSPAKPFDRHPGNQAEAIPFRRQDPQVFRYTAASDQYLAYDAAAEPASAGKDIVQPLAGDLNLSDCLSSEVKRIIAFQNNPPCHSLCGRGIRIQMVLPS